MKVRLKNKTRGDSFTLMELLIVIIIISILAAIGVIHYRRVVSKAQAAKAEHGISLIAEAEKIYQIDNGGYIAVSAGNVDSTVGSGVTGLDLSGLDNDDYFNYSVTGAGLIRARNSVVIGSCSVNSVISLDLATGAWSVDACFR